MKIHFLSDTHDQQYTIPLDADICIHLGDAGNGVEELIHFANKCRRLGIDHLVVPGNHDYWHTSYEDLYTILYEHGVKFLKEGSTYVKDHITFVGGTLFSNFRSNKKDAWDVDDYKQACLNFGDFRRISYDNSLITPSMYITLFNKTLNNINKFRNIPNTVVLSHFPPHPSCSPPEYDPNSDIAPYFSNDIDLTGFSYWLYGHTHYNIDKDINGCRVISNALGFPHEQSHTTFNHTSLLEL